VNYYNEFHPPAAAILRGLIADKLIPEGHVDDRSITEIQPSDIAGYTQCHFFAGIGGWPLALQLAGWPTNQPVWTGSCPCQPFSSAGKQKGKSDERHLWPVWFRLIRECRPSVCFGEQVASAITHGWLDEVADDLEGEGYAIGAAVLPACSVGAPHRRDRLWFVADNDSKRCNGEPISIRKEQKENIKINRSCDGDVADTKGNGWGQSNEDTRGGATGVYTEQGAMSCNNSNGTMVNANEPRSQRRVINPERGSERSPWETSLGWLTGADGKLRPVMPRVRLLAHGFPERVACLHGFGNAIVPQVAATFIETYMNINGELYAEVKE
jgi:DNA (cytosine-5)-methyltransferase 1